MSGEANNSSRRIPFGQEFTPATLAKEIPANDLLPWLLQEAGSAENRNALSEAIQANCLSHIKGESDRRDMASHVVTALRSYGLIEQREEDGVALTDAGAQLLGADETSFDRMFARHILTECNGQLLVDAILRYQLRGERALLEDLAREMGLSPTDKSISSMKAWLARAGVLESGNAYRVDQGVLADVLGSNVGSIYGLSDVQFEFLLGAKILSIQSGQEFVSAPQAATIAEERNPELRVPRKALSGFLRALETKGALETRKEAGSGGSFHSVKLRGSIRDLTENELTRIFEQAQYGFALHELEPLAEVLARLDEGTAVELGMRGEMLAVHLCMILGLRVVDWRARSPASEIDLIAERTVGLAYQRWAVQVKNTTGSLTNDRVDRELGASLGTGVTHVLFVVPRAGLTSTAVAEVFARSRVSTVHVLYLTEKELAPEKLSLSRLLTALKGQADALGVAKSDEASRRER